MKLGREVSRHNELDNWRNTHRFESVMATKWLLLTISETEPGLWDRLNPTFPIWLNIPLSKSSDYNPNRVGGSLYGSWGTATSTATGDCAFLLDSHELLY